MPFSAARNLLRLSRADQKFVGSTDLYRVLEAAVANLDVVVWDFDGVLNRNIVDGRFNWADNFEADIGRPFEPLQRTIFDGPIKDVIVGRVDLLELIKRWADDVGYEGPAQGVLDYWFDKDDLVDPESLKLLEATEQAGLRNVIATNNEARRANYIEDQMGFGKRIERLFASGRLGVAKPDPKFFEIVSETLAVAPSKLFLIDDSQSNVAAAKALGWKAFHFRPGCYETLAAKLNIDPALRTLETGLIGGAEKREIGIVDYDPTWLETFNEHRPGPDACRSTR